MRMRLTIVLVLLFFGSAAAMAQTAARDDLEGLIKEALANNPELKALRARADAQKQRIAQMRSLDSPQLTVEFSQADLAYFPDPVRGQKEIDYGLLQMVPYPGKLYAAGNSARRSADMAESDYKALQLSIIAQLKKAWYNLYFIQHEKSINFETRKLMQQFVAITRRQYELGKASQSDVLKAEVELAVLIKAGLGLDRDQAGSEASLNRILGRTSAKEFGWIGDIGFEFPEFSFDQVMPVVRELNPELKSRDLNVGVSRAELSLAQNGFGPDLMAKGTYKAMQGYTDDVWDLMLGLSVPVSPWSFQKYSSRVKETRFLLGQSESEYAQKENQLAEQLTGILAELRASGLLRDLYMKDWIPRLKQTLESVLSNYQTGKVDVLTVIDTYRTLLEARVDYEMSVRDYMSSLADLEQVSASSAEELKARIK
jgi:outer membrane protein, heavy metal efflux system